MTVTLNITIAWLGILAGLVFGAAMGLRFHEPNWLGGYGSWPRRMIRLGHISFFGIAMLNLAYAVTVKYLGWPEPIRIASVSLAAANVLMPATCFAAAFAPRFRNAFVLPVACTLTGVVGLLVTRLVTL